MFQRDSALVLEILKQGQTLKMSLFEDGELVSTLRHYSQCPVSFPEIEKICREVASILGRPEKKDALDASRINNLKKAGQLLWDSLLTLPVKEGLKNSPTRNLILCVDEELISIPWETLYDGESFLCLKFNLGRLVRTAEQKSASYEAGVGKKLKMLILANPTNDLKSAYSEGIYIKNQFNRKSKDIGIDFKSTHINTLYVKKNLRDYDIVHFAGHCEYEQDKPGNSGWVLDDGRLSAQEIRKMGQASKFPTLVFSNACYSAKVSRNSADSYYQEKTYSLASAFLFSGARLYVGAIRRIEDPASLVFAREFYAQLIRGRPIGESLRLGRLRLIKEYGQNCISWAGYLFYGDPAFAFFKQETSAFIQEIKKNARLYRKAAIRFFIALIIISIAAYFYVRLPTLNCGTYFLFHESRNFFLQGKNQQAISLCEQIIKRDPLFLATYPLLADTYQRLGDRDNALKYYFEYALFSERRQDKKSLADAYIGLGWTYHLRGEYSNALDFYSKAINLSALNRDKLNEAKALRKLAVWHMDKEDNDRALELLMKSSEINRERQHIYEHKYNLACDYYNIGLVFMNKRDFNAARDFYAKSKGLFEKLNLSFELSDCYFNLGQICLFEKQYQKAYDYYMKGLNIDTTQGNKLKLAGGYNMIAELYLLMDNRDEAEKFLNQAVVLAKQIDATLELAAAYYNLGLLYKHKGEKEKAKDFFRQAEEARRLAGFAPNRQLKEELSAGGG